MNSFGRVFRVHIFGESHGPVIGVTVDGCSPGVRIDSSIFAEDLDRRAPSKPEHTRRKESDKVEILSGVYNGYSTGAPMTLIVKNDDTREADYDGYAEHPRPSHVDYVNYVKSLGFCDMRGGGHSSGRVTVALVIAGCIAKQVIKKLHGTKIVSSVVKGELKRDGDSVGGVVTCVVYDVPKGLGEPFFDSVESVISHAVFSVPGIKGIEFGDGFACVSKHGSERNDRFVDKHGTTSSNNEGGINGGLTNGNNIVFRAAVKPTPSISVPQMTYHFSEEKVKELIVKGRHDTCFATRVPVIVEAVTAIALLDLMMLEGYTYTYNLKNSLAHEIIQQKT